MAQGFKKLATRPGAPSSASSSKRAPLLKRGARVIKPKKSAAVQSQALQKKLSSEQIKRAESQTAARLAKPSGDTGLKLVQAASGPTRSKQHRKK